MTGGQLRLSFLVQQPSWVVARGLKRPIQPLQIIGARASGGPGGPLYSYKNEKKKENKKGEKKTKKFGPNTNQGP